jgi:gamma-glutamyltranspeptidase
MKRTKLALTLRHIAINPTSFYNGPLAYAIVADIQELGKCDYV